MPCAGQQAKSGNYVVTSVARPWRDQGKPDEACDLLAPVYGWFTEGLIQQSSRVH